MVGFCWKAMMVKVIMVKVMMIMVKDHHDLDRIPMMACTNHTWSCETSILITEHFYLPFQMKLCPQNIKVSCCNQGRQS